VWETSGVGGKEAGEVGRLLLAGQAFWVVALALLERLLLLSVGACNTSSSSFEASRTGRTRAVALLVCPTGCPCSLTGCCVDRAVGPRLSMLVAGRFKFLPTLVVAGTVSTFVAGGFVGLLGGLPGSP